MATINEKTKCDIGGEIYDKHEDCRNDIAIVNGENTRVYGDVCDKHCSEVAKMIDERFPRNKFIKSE